MRKLLEDPPGAGANSTSMRPAIGRTARGMWTLVLPRRPVTPCSRSTRPAVGDVLIEVLGKEFDGVLGCDYFSAYRRYQREFGVLLQFCLAHLIRDVKFLTTLSDARDRGLWGAVARGVAAIVRGDPPEGSICLPRRSGTNWRPARTEVLRCGTQGVPETKHSRNLAKRFEKHGGELFPVPHGGREWSRRTNLAEQAIRFVVLDRRVTQGDAERGGEPVV